MYLVTLELHVTARPRQERGVSSPKFRLMLRHIATQPQPTTCINADTWNFNSLQGKERDRHWGFTDDLDMAGHSMGPADARSSPIWHGRGGRIKKCAAIVNSSMIKQKKSLIWSHDIRAFNQCI